MYLFTVGDHCYPPVMGNPDDNSKDGPGVTATNWALGIAVTWSAALIVSAFVAPWGTSVTATVEGGDQATETVVTTTSTLVGHEGLGVLIPVSIPLVFSLGCTWALLRYRRFPSRTLGRFAWVLTASMALFTVLALMSIGFFMIPVTIALVVACAKGAPMKAPKGSPFSSSEAS